MLRYKALFFLMLAIQFLFGSYALAVEKAQLPISTREIVETKNNNDQEDFLPLSEEIIRKLEDPKKVELLERMGITKEEAQKRIAGLSDAEIRELINQGPAQAAGNKVTIGITTLLLIIIIALLI